jgi:regulator of sigma E protease
MLAQPPSLWVTLLAFVFMLGPLVFFHELGHYLVARWFKVPAEVFSIGFGREIVGWSDRQGTRWKVGWLPLGGYVKFVGDMGPASAPTDTADAPPGSFQLRPVWQRFLIVLAGPAANFLLAIVIFAAVFMTFGAPGTNMVGWVKPKTPAAAVGLQPGDRILSVAGRKTRTFDDVHNEVISRPGATVPLTIQRNDRTTNVLVTIKSDEFTDPSGKKSKFGLLGVSPATVSVFEAVPMAVDYTAQVTVSIVEGVSHLIIGRGSREEVGGPIKIAQLAGQTASLGTQPFIQLLALLSINLGFINLLPVPMLDGGHLFFYTIEAVRRRPISERALEWSFRGGLAAILALLVFTTFNDLGSLGLWDRLQRLIG